MAWAAASVVSWSRCSYVRQVVLYAHIQPVTTIPCYTRTVGHNLAKYTHARWTITPPRPPPKTPTRCTYWQRDHTRHAARTSARWHARGRLARARPTARQCQHHRTQHRRQLLPAADDVARWMDRAPRADARQGATLCGVHGGEQQSDDALVAQRVADRLGLETAADVPKQRVIRHDEHGRPVYQVSLNPPPSAAPRDGPALLVGRRKRAASESAGRRQRRRRRTVARAACGPRRPPSTTWAADAVRGRLWGPRPPATLPGAFEVLDTALRREEARERDEIGVEKDGVEEDGVEDALSYRDWPTSSYVGRVIRTIAVEAEPTLPGWKLANAQLSTKGRRHSVVVYISPCGS